MRCKNCGWENPDGQEKCEKCHGSLVDAVPAHKPTTPVSDRMKSTVAEGVIFNDPVQGNAPQTCPKCGYPISDNSTSCPNCNHELQPAPTATYGYFAVVHLTCLVNGKRDADFKTTKRNKIACCGKKLHPSRFHTMTLQK